MSLLQLGSYHLTENSLPYLVAEIGVNHEGSIILAKRMIEEAKEGGANCAKFQTYIPEGLINLGAYPKDEQSKIRQSFQQLQQHGDFFREKEYILLAEHCKKIGIDFLSTPFDLDAVSYLDPLLSFYKIASGDINCIPLLREVGRKKKPVILSTGASSLSEIRCAVELLKEEGVKDIILLQCTMSYPCQEGDVNLKMMLDLRQAFPECLIGYSDHSPSAHAIRVITVAASMGAVVLEKHFTYDKKLKGNDHFHSMDKQDLKNLKTSLVQINKIQGKNRKNSTAAEQKIQTLARRSIVTTTLIQKGEILQEKNLTFQRPSFGISVSSWDQVLGRRTNRQIPKNQILQWEDLEE